MENAGVDGGGVLGGNVNTKPLQEWEINLPPFLRKIYKLVDDPETNSFITWNASGTSFIIPDHNKFAAEVLPKYFKTTNFSSFVYQLNNYGFSKISWNRYEYMNPWFQSGKEDLLKNMKRRNKKDPVTIKKRGRGSTPIQDSAKSTMESELDAIMNEQKCMKEQIQKLKSSLNNMADQIAILQTADTNLPDIEDDETDDVVLLKQLPGEKNDQENGSNAKKIKTNEPQMTDSAFKAADKAEVATKELVSSDDGSGSSTQEQTMNKVTENFTSWKHWLDYEVEGNVASEYSKAFVDLDDQMMTFDIATQREYLTPEPFDLNMEDECHGLKLWT